MPDENFTWIDTIPSILAGIFFILQIIYGFVYSNNTTNQIISYLGVGIFIVSSFFGIMPVFTFSKNGGVEKGKSYINTTKVVDSGIYSIMRHPQYSSFILWAIAAMLLFQNLIVIIIGVAVIILTYYDMIREEKVNMEKFGESYKNYMLRVPRVNFFLGIVRLLVK